MACPTTERPLASLQHLETFVHETASLQKVGYVLEQYTTEQLGNKHRCRNCGLQVKQRQRRADEKSNPAPPQLCESKSSDAGLTLDKSRQNFLPRIGAVAAANVAERPLKMICIYHTGRVVKKFHTCCHQHVSSVGCVQSHQHGSPVKSSTEVRKYWTLYKTPSNGNLSSEERTRRRAKALGESTTDHVWRDAVALDCEMGTAASGDTELIRLTVVDFFTGEALIDKLVQPSVPMRHYNTRYSGVTTADMRTAVSNKSCIFGRDAARKEIWRFVSPQTIVVMHGGHNDLVALRWIHERIVDTFILESRMNTQLEGGKSLKNLSEKRLGRLIQKGKGHCSLEDSMACRDLAHWYVAKGLAQDTEHLSKDLNNMHISASEAESMA